MLNKLESYSRISALGSVGHCTSHFKRAACISCRPRVDVHKGAEGSGPCGRMWTEGGGVKNLIFCGRHKWMTPYSNKKTCKKKFVRRLYIIISLVMCELDNRRRNVYAAGTSTRVLPNSTTQRRRCNNCYVILFLSSNNIWPL